MKTKLIAGLVCGMCLTTMAAAQPTATPGGDDKKFAAPGEKQEFPGPRGSKITFPTGLYDEKADAAADIRAAREKARKENKRVLVMWGENNCGFCVFLNDLLKTDPTVSPVVKSDYVWVKADIGKFNKNIELASYYNTPLLEQGFGAPALTVIDPDTDKGVDRRGGNSMTAKPMTMENVFDPKVIGEFLMNHKAPAKPAMVELTNAQTTAGKQSKKVLAFFTMPLNEMCDVASAWLERGDVQAVLSKGFVIARVDTERMIGGQDVLVKTAGTKAIMAPFMVFLNADGTIVTESGKFTALPKSDDQINGFLDGVQKAFPALSASDKEVLAASLRKMWEPKAEETK